MIDPLELHSLADGELSQTEANRVREELRQDTVASAEYDSILNLKDFVRENAPRHNSDEAWVTCQARIRELDRANRVEGYVRKYAWGLCAAFFLCIFSARFLVQGVQGTSVQTADLLRFSNGLTSRRAPMSENTAARDKWLDDVLGHAKQIISTDQLTVLGGNSGFIDGMRVSALDLSDARGGLRLLVIRGQLNVQDTQAMPGNPRVYAGRMGDVNSVAWTVDGSTVILQAPRTFDELQSIAGRISVR